MTAARAARRILALTGLIVFLAPVALAVVPPQGGQAAYDLPLRAFDLPGYRSATSDAEQAGAERALTEAIGGTWEVYSWNPQTRTPSEMIGSGVEVSGFLAGSQDVKAAAERIIQASPAAFKADLRDLRFLESTNSPPVTNSPDGNRRPGKWAAHFQQTYQGIDVVGGEVHLTFLESGRFFALGSTYYQDISVNSNPALSADQAKEIARSSVPFQPERDSVEVAAKLLILPVPVSEISVDHHLVWQVRVHVAEPIAVWITDVDAHSGRILRRTNDVSFFGYSGSAVGQVERFSYCDGSNQETFPYVFVNVYNVASTYADGDGNWTIPGGAFPGTLYSHLSSPFVDVINAQGPNAQVVETVFPNVPFQIAFDNSNSRADERDVFRTVQDLHNFFETFAPGFSYTNGPVMAWVNENNTCNAYHYAGVIHFYQAGNGCANTGQMMDVVAHEFGHGVQRTILGWQGDEGVGEGNGDVTGFLMSGSSVFGRGWSNCVNGMRDANNTLRYPEDVVGQEIHGAGRVIAGFHWDAMQDQIARYGDWGKYSAAYDWFNGRVLQHPTTQPAQVLATFIANDDDGNLLNGTPQYDSYCLAATNHGFTCPSATLPLPPGCNTYHQGPQDLRVVQYSSFWAGVAVNPTGSDDKDIGVYPEGGGMPFATSSVGSGTDFVVGDFNHNPTGTYQPRVFYGGVNTDYVVEWDAGPDVLNAGSVVSGTVGGGSGECGLIRVWDVFLEAGRTYRFRSRWTGGPAMVRLALFRNPGASPFWTGRSFSEFEFLSGESHDYTAPASDTYGLVVFNDSADSPPGSYDLHFLEVPVPLVADVCQSWSISPRMFSYPSGGNFWRGVAVNPTGTDDKDLVLYEDEDGTGTPLATSVGTSGTDFIVCDYSNLVGAYYARVQYGDPAAPYVVEAANGIDQVGIGSNISGAVGGGAGDCGLIKMWQLPVEAGKSYRFMIESSESADIRMAVFQNPGTGAWFGGRSHALFEVTNWNGHVHTATGNDTYAVVVFNNLPDSPSGTYTMRVHEELTTLSSGDCQAGTGVPRSFRFTQIPLYWTCVGVNPSGADDKDIYVYYNPDGSGTPLGTSNGAEGTDFVVGDFNHNSTGTYYPYATYGSTTEPYVFEWDDGPDSFPVGARLQGSVGGAAGGCGLVKAWDVYLQAGVNYRVSLVQSGAADPRVSLFRNPTNGTYWVGRSGSLFERAAAQGPVTYTAPASDFYGLVVFNAAPGSPAGDYALRVQEAPVPLVSSVCQSWPSSPRTFSFGPPSPHWAMIGVNSASQDPKSVDVWSDPDGISTALGSSAGGAVSFVAGDFTHLASGTFYGNVYGGWSTGSYLAEWDDEGAVLAPGMTVGGSIPDGSSCGAFRIADLPLEAGKTYRFALATTGPADFRMALFASTPTHRWVGRSGAVFEAAAGDTPPTFSPPSTDVYGVTVFNAAPGNPAGAFTVRIDEVTTWPDLVVDHFELSPPAPQVGEPVNVRVMVRNVGDGLAPASLTGYQLDGVDQGTMDTPILEVGGAGWSTWLELGLLPEGGHSGLACTDVNGVIVEADEGNNCGRHVIMVQSSAGVGEAAALESGIMVPNPYRAGTAILLTAGADESRATVRIYSVQGQLVRTLVDGSLGKGTHPLRWDGRSDDGLRLHAGVYFLRANIGPLEVRKTLQLLR